MTVRQLLLVVVLVGAAFLGGAFVNGPGLQWAQARLLRSLGLNNGGEIASIELQPTTSHEPGIKTPAEGSTPVDLSVDRLQGPIAPVPSLQTEADSPKKDMSDPSVGLMPRQRPNSKKTASSAIQAPTLSLSSDPVSVSAPDNQVPLRSDRKVTLVGNATVQSPGSTSSSMVGDAAPAILDSLAALLPVDSHKSVPPAHSSPSPKLDASAQVSGTDSWAILEHRMEILGVTRYTMDGTPGGRVVFSCLIPLAGRQAVAQRFEGEGDDIMQAAQMALRRIALWRASPPSPP